MSTAQEGGAEIQVLGVQDSSLLRWRAMQADHAVHVVPALFSRGGC